MACSDVKFHVAEVWKQLSFNTTHRTVESSRIILHFFLSLSPSSTTDLTAPPVRSLFWLISPGLLYLVPFFLPSPFRQLRMASATDNMSAAEKLQLEHAQAAEGHHVTVEEVPDEDLRPHDVSAGSADSSGLSDKAAGKQKATSPSPSPAPAKASRLDIQSQELFPELGAPKSQAAKNVPKWGAASVLSTNGTGHGSVAAAAANGGPGAVTPSSGTATPKGKSTPSGVPLVHLPGRYTETLNLEPQELKPREQLRRPLAQILQDINRTSRAQVKSVPAARGQRFEVVGPQESAQQALKELVKQIGSTVCFRPRHHFCEARQC